MLLIASPLWAFDPANIPATKVTPSMVPPPPPGIAASGKYAGSGAGATRGVTRPLTVEPPPECGGANVACCDLDKDSSTETGTTYWKTLKSVKKATQGGASLIDEEIWHSGTDYCKYENGPYVHEYSCQNYDSNKAKMSESGVSQIPMWVTIECPEGSVCSGGKCVTKQECDDSDLGKSYFQPGQVKTKVGDGQWLPPEPDNCLDGKILKEQVCVATEGGATWTTFYVDCSQFGAVCNPKVTVEIPISEITVATVEGAACDLPQDCQAYDGKNPLDDGDNDGVADIWDYAWKDPKVQQSPYPLPTATVGKYGDKCVVAIDDHFGDGKSTVPNCKPESYAIDSSDLMINEKNASDMIAKTCNKKNSTDDSDKDGISTCVETGLGLNPNNKDSDGDGLPEVHAILVKTLGESGIFIYCNGSNVVVYRKDNKTLCIPDPEGGTEWPSFFRYYTDPLNPDTDGDGLMDGDDNFMGASPLSWDSDCDGLADSLEDTGIKATTNKTKPTYSDSDGDGLGDGWTPSGKLYLQSLWPPLLWGEDRNLNGKKEPWETDPMNADTDGDRSTDLDDLCPLNASQTCCPLYFIPAMDPELTAEFKDLTDKGCSLGITELDPD